ncbi:hypothetical protein TNCV_2256091, partial [Trichonephila clavipes]
CPDRGIIMVFPINELIAKERQDKGRISQRNISTKQSKGERNDTNTNAAYGAAGCFF